MTESIFDIADRTDPIVEMEIIGWRNKLGTRQARVRMEFRGELDDQAWAWEGWAHKGGKCRFYDARPDHSEASQTGPGDQIPGPVVPPRSGGREVDSGSGSEGP